LEQGEAATGRIEAAIRNKSEGDHRVFNLNLIMSSISLFDGLVITETDGLPASASRLL
jgi:hypothetical protein